MGIYGQVAEEAVYGGSRLDASGEQLMGDQHYELHFDQATLPDAKFFWSITLYELPSRFLAANPIDRYSIGDRTAGITYADDGSLTITLQAAAPEDRVQRANWLPTPTDWTVHGHLPPLRTRTRSPNRQLVATTDHQDLLAPGASPPHLKADRSARQGADRPVQTVGSTNLQPSRRLR